MVLAASLALPPGPAAACFAAPWLIVTMLLALVGLVRLGEHRFESAAEPAHDAALVFIAIGGLWTVVTRLGWQPLGFSRMIVLLTAVHFHYAAFLLPVLAGRMARELPGVFSTIAVFGVIAGVPLTAAGITVSPHLEFAAGLFMALAGLLVALGHLRLACRATRPGPLLLWSVSGVSLLSGMLLAGLYAWVHYTGAMWLDIPRMLPSHGMLNAIGFTGCALLAWHGHAVAGSTSARERKS
jgi:hypothetical protein